MGLTRPVRAVWETSPHTPVPREDDRSSEMKPCVKVRWRVNPRVRSARFDCLFCLLLYVACSGSSSEQTGRAVSEVQARVEVEIYTRVMSALSETLLWLYQPALRINPTQSQLKSAWIGLSQQPWERLSCWRP